MADLLTMARARREAAIEQSANNRLNYEQKTAPDGRLYTKPKSTDLEPVFSTSRKVNADAQCVENIFTFGSVTEAAIQAKANEAARERAELQNASLLLMTMENRPEARRFLN
ncbi:MAG: hypothetical protein AAGF53_15590 [Pseudomonadota bacterium]